MTMNCVAIIQARMGASRLPNKMLLHLHGHPIIEWVWHRTLRARRLNSVIVAIPDCSGDDVLAMVIGQLGARVFRGSEIDVVARVHGAAVEAEATHIVRVCADNPLIVGEEIDHLIDDYLAHPSDYTYNHIPRGNSYPDGLGAEIISRSVLETIHREATRPEHREHLLNYVWDHADRFSIRTFDPPDPAIRRPELKLDVDTLADYSKMVEHPLHIDMSACDIVETFTTRRS